MLKRLNWQKGKEEDTLRAKDESDRQLYNLRDELNWLKVFEGKTYQEVEKAKLQTKDVLKSGLNKAMESFKL